MSQASIAVISAGDVPTANARGAAVKSVYRAEIDGLRAIAVVPVLLYHAGFELFRGGFTGVDIFFVISGYLITSKIADDLGAGRFSIAKFYERRARRILPALFLIMGFCLAVGWSNLLPGDFRQLTRSVASVIVFLSNMFFWKQGGYFGSSSEIQPLIHTWSLAVEEQFYLLFPLLMMAVYHRSRRNLLIAIWVVALVSFALCIYASTRFPTANFYLAPFRFWELMVGSLCALVAWRGSTRLRSAMAMAGVVLIGCGIFLLDGHQAFPGWPALLPVVGAALIILGGEADKGVGRILACRPLVGIGLISYSLYLWHQPILAFMRLDSFVPLTLADRLVAIAASLLFATLSWKFVETPFRRPGVVSTRALVRMALGCVGVFGAFVVYSETTDAAAWRLHKVTEPRILRLVASAQGAANDEPKCPSTTADVDFPPCWLTGSATSPRRIGVFGDSHAISLRNALKHLGETRGVAILFASSPGCPSLLGAHVINGNGPAPRCAAMARAQFDAARSARLDGVLLVGRWSLYTRGDPSLRSDSYLLATSGTARVDREGSRRAFAELTESTVRSYRAAGLPVHVLDQVPEQAVAVGRLVAWLEYGAPPASLAALARSTSIPVSLSDAHNRFAAQSWTRAGALLIAPRPLFAERGRFIWSDGTVSWYGDSNHMSLVGAERVAAVVGQSGLFGNNRLMPSGATGK